MSGDRGLQFNLSHAGDLVVVALCVGQRIGVDVEEVRAIESLLEIADAHFTRSEREFIFSQEPQERRRAFFRIWTRKEAYVKAVGNGLSIPLNSFDTVLSSRQHGRVFDSCTHSVEPPAWQVMDVQMPWGYVAAIGVETGVDELVYFEL